MSTFTKCAAPATTGSCDPTRHVNYQQGMVLGVDDFTQEFSYLSGRDQWMARDLIGYGTVWGLSVSSELDVKGPRVVVSPGVAVSPCGQMIRVPTAQCAYLNDWLKLPATKKELTDRSVVSPSTLKVYIVLCYRDCPTDNVPIPGEPCRSEDDLMAPSRLADDFALEVRFDPPGQTEEDALRRLVNWLNQVTVTNSSTGTTSLEDFLGALRLANSPLDPTLNIRLPAPSSLKIPAAQLCSYLRAAFRVWAVELRTKWRPDQLSNWHSCCGHSKGAEVAPEECVLLAEVDVPVSIPSGGADWQVQDPAGIALNEDARPFLIHLRALQELLLCGRNIQAAGSSSSGSGPVTLAGDASGPVNATVVAAIQGRPVSSAAPALGQVLTFDAGTWKPAQLPLTPPPINPGNVSAAVTFGLTSSNGTSPTYARADHTHGTPPRPILGGDVTGDFGATTVGAIQSVPVVKPTGPGSGEVLTFRNSRWQAETLPAGVSSNAVERPAGLGQYLIVAAGVVPGDPTQQQSSPVYNGLKVNTVADGQINVIFTGYAPPTPSGPQYVVKVLPVVTAAVAAALPKLAVYFDSFGKAKNGFFLRVLNDGQPVAANQINTLTLMIEVSQYVGQLIPVG
ncbi:MAG TPA: hypothetical protein VN937_05935 [Blastocatellia bacterium]|nr:hypothetical protein [Blastocatellia bacterium]